MKRTTARKLESVYNQHQLTFVLQPLHGLREKPIDTASADWPWQQDINWFLVIAEFKRLTQQHLKQCFLLEVWSENTCLLALPLCSSEDGRYWSSLTDVYSPSFNIISPATPLIQNPWQYLFDALTLLVPNWVHCQLAPLRQEQIQQLTLVKGLLRTHVFQHSENWVAHFNSAEAFWSKRPSQLNNTIKRKRAKLLKNGSRVEIHTNLTEELILTYWQVYQQSWKQPEIDPYFINWLANYSSANGMLRLGVLYIDNQPLACQLWLVNQAKAAIYKLAQDQAFDNFSPGTVLMADMVNYVIEIDNVTSIDFLTGNDNYKALWMDHSFELFGAELFNLKSISAHWLWARQQIKTAAKFAVRKLNNLFLWYRNDNKG